MLKANLFISIVLSTLAFITYADEMAPETRTENSFTKFTSMLIGESENTQYNQTIKQYVTHFKERFVTPIDTFSKENLTIYNNTLFYPFAGADISYPLLFFPNLKQYVLVGLEFAGQIEVIKDKYDLSSFQPQIEGFLKSGFFKTMNMSAQMHYKQGVIPMLVAQIGLLDGMVENITPISEPFKGLLIDFKHNNINKKLYYFRANLDDNSSKNGFFEFLQNNKLIDNCMLKASSYKLHQIEFKQLRQFMLNNCKLILQDDTGMPIKYLQQQKREIKLFGDYVQPYGNEFKPYYQKNLADLYKPIENKVKLNFCYGYGCDKTEANILTATTTDYINEVDLVEPEIEAN